MAGVPWNIVTYSVLGKRNHAIYKPSLFDLDIKRRLDMSRNVIVILSRCMVSKTAQGVVGCIPYFQSMMVPGSETVKTWLLATGIADAIAPRTV